MDIPLRFGAGALAAAALLTAGCGGGGDDAQQAREQAQRDASLETLALQRALQLATDRHARRVTGETHRGAAAPATVTGVVPTRTVALAPADTAQRQTARADTGAAPAATDGRVDGVGACMHRLSAALRSRTPVVELDLGCLAGRYRGLTPQGQACQLEVAAPLRGAFRFVRDAQGLRLLRDAPPQDTVVYAIDALGGGARPALRLTRLAHEGTDALDTLVVSAVPADAAGPERLLRMSYERSAGRQSSALRCEFQGA